MLLVLPGEFIVCQIHGLIELVVEVKAIQFATCLITYGGG